MQPAIVVEHVTKVYPRHPQHMRVRGQKLSDYFLNWLSSWRSPQPFHALNDISFRVNPGESVGLIGSNGSGKSTLLRVITGITQPTSGRVVVNGQFRELFALNAGFNMDVSGRKNIYLYAAMKKISMAEIENKLDKIISYAGLRQFIDEPVRTYSTGMRGRLGFSLIIHTLPDIVIIDEALSAGDEAFRSKTKKALISLRRQERTLVLVSHSLGMIKNLCTRVVWLEGGNLRMDGPTLDVINEYEKYQKVRPEEDNFSLSGIDGNDINFDM
jgi:ABC-type polysaccharide/polyol phosphate transport system ATPase subunit